MCMKLSAYVGYLQAFEAEHGDLDVFVLGGTTHIPGKPFVEVGEPKVPRLEDCYAGDNWKFILPVGKQMLPRDQDQYPTLGKVALLDSKIPQVAPVEAPSMPCAETPARPKLKQCECCGRMNPASASSCESCYAEM